MLSVAPVMEQGSTGFLIASIIFIAVLGIVGVLLCTAGVNDLINKTYNTSKGDTIAMTVAGVVIIAASSLLITGVIDSASNQSHQYDTMMNELDHQGYSNVIILDKGFVAEKDNELVRCYFAEMDETWKIICED